MRRDALTVVKVIDDQGVAVAKPGPLSRVIALATSDVPVFLDRNQVEALIAALSEAKAALPPEGAFIHAL